LGERVVRNDEVVGSIPISSTIFSLTGRTASILSHGAHHYGHDGAETAPMPSAAPATARRTIAGVLGSASSKFWLTGRTAKAMTG
jgi:hypothetical protein